MDNFERRLKADAEAIDGQVTPDVAARIEASLRGVTPEQPPARRQSRPVEFRWWLLSSLTGVAAVLLVVVALNRPTANDSPVPLPESVVDIESLPPTPLPESATPDGTSVEAAIVPLTVAPADFTDPLAEELEAMKSDLERAREAVEKDLRFTF